MKSIKMIFLMAIIGMIITTSCSTEKEELTEVKKEKVQSSSKEGLLPIEQEIITSLNFNEADIDYSIEVCESCIIDAIKIYNDKSGLSSRTECRVTEFMYIDYGWPSNSTDGMYTVLCNNGACYRTFRRNSSITSTYEVVRAPCFGQSF